MGIVTLTETLLPTMVKKLIFTDEIKIKDHPDWVALFEQCPNANPIFKGHLVDWNAVHKHVNCYEDNPKLKLEETKTEFLWVDGNFRNCTTWVYSEAPSTYSSEEFEMRLIKQNIEVRGGVTKLLTGQNPFHLEDYDYVVYGGKK